MEVGPTAITLLLLFHLGQVSFILLSPFLFAHWAEQATGLAPSIIIPVLFKVVGSILKITF
jgi:hypothetical protein